MKVSNLVAQLQRMPQELEVMIPCEAGLDYAMGIGILQVGRTKRDWSGTPVGNYRVIDGYEPQLETGQTRTGAPGENGPLWQRGLPGGVGRAKRMMATHAKVNQSACIRLAIPGTIFKRLFLAVS